jgi:hypothetical protein
MTRPLYEPTDEERVAWELWVAERPDAVRVVAERFSPWQLYRLKTSGHRVTLVAFDEETTGDITLRVFISGDHNFLAFERSVFGIKPDDLEPCDPPEPGERVGSLNMNPDDVRAAMRAIGGAERN